jgi:hypothetical protein
MDGGSIGRRERVKVEQGQAAFIADDRLAVRSGMITPAVLPQPRERETRGELVAVPTDEAHAGGGAPRHHAEAFVLDLVNPVGARRGQPGRGRPVRRSRAGGGHARPCSSAA